MASSDPHAATPSPTETMPLLTIHGAALRAMADGAPEDAAHITAILAQRLREKRRLTVRMFQALDAYWLHCDGLPKDRYPRSRSTAEDWWTRFEKYRAKVEAQL